MYIVNRSYTDRGGVQYGFGDTFPMDSDPEKIKRLLDCGILKQVFLKIETPAKAAVQVVGEGDEEEDEVVETFDAVEALNPERKTRKPKK
jgi:hypothetical protein